MRVEQVRAGRRCPVGDHISTREDTMVEIQVAVEDPTRLKGLLVGLAGLLDGSSLSFDERRNELCVSTEWEPCDVDAVIGVFESWLAADGMGASARLCIGDAAYDLAGSARPRQTNRVSTPVPGLKLVVGRPAGGNAGASTRQSTAAPG
jgi:hypothetical protein